MYQGFVFRSLSKNPSDSKALIANEVYFYFGALTCAFYLFYHTATALKETNRSEGKEFRG